MFQLPEWGIGFVVDFILSIVFLIILPIENMKIRERYKNKKSFTKIYKNFFAEIFLFDSYLIRTSLMTVGLTVSFSFSVLAFPLSLLVISEFIFQSLFLFDKLD